MWFFEGRGELKVDIEANAAAGDGLKYVGLRIYDAEPRVAELSEPADPRSSAVRPNRRGRKKGSGSYDSKDAPLLEEIHALVENEKPVGLWVAVLTVADRAPGKGGTENRAKRLVLKYKAMHSLP